MSRQLWCGSIRGDVDADALWDAFARFGEVEDLQLHPARLGSDFWAVVTYRRSAGAAAALLDLERRQPALTIKSLKLREYVGKVAYGAGGQWPAQQAAPPLHQQQWREQQRQPPLQQKQQQQQQRASPALADAEDPEGRSRPGAAAWRFDVGGWGVAGAEHEAADEEDWGSGERHYDFGSEGEEAGEEEEEEDDDYDPLVELWVGNLWTGVQRTAIRRAFECFGEVRTIALQSAPGGSSLRFALVQLPASAAETALEELDGLTVFELSGDLPLQVKQSTRSLKAIQLWEQAQQGRAAQHAARAARQQTQQAQREQGHPAPVAADGLAALCAGGEAVPLAGPVRPTKRFLVCEGPPSAVLWVGSIAGCATLDDMHSLFSRFGQVARVRLNSAPGRKHGQRWQFAFVQLGSAAEAERAHGTLQGERGAVICGGRPLKLRYAWPRSQVVSTSAGQGACPAAGWPAGGPSSAAVQTGPAEQSAEACAALGAPRHAAGQSGVPPAPVQPCCAGCGAPAEVVPLKRCSLCRAEWYCGGPCQLARWEAGHAAECGQLQQLAAVLAAPGPAALAPDLLKLLVAALQQPAGRQSRMVHEALRHAVPTAAQVAAAGT